MNALAAHPGARYGRWRRAVQAAFALFFLALPFAGATAVAGTMVALKLGPLDLVEPASALSAALASRTLRWSLALGAAPLLVLAAALGPVYCSWACPFGLLSEILDRLRPRRRWSGRPWLAARRTRLVALALLLGGSAALAIPLAPLLAPPRLVTVLPLEARAAAAVPIATATLLGAALALELIGPRRILCRALCPAGALGALLRTRATARPRFDPGRCLCPGSPPCLQSCPWGIDPRGMEPGDGCTTCLACVDRCPSGALTFLRSTQPPPTPPQEAS